jgi:RHS repeat-associated protein
MSSYTPPSLGTGNWATQYAYDLDRRVQTVTRPDGVTIASGYDSAGRLHTVTIPQGTLTRNYSTTTGQLSSLVAQDGETTAYTHDGFLRTGVTWSGPVAGNLTLGFDSTFRVNSQTVNGTALSFGYDNDSLLIQAGAMTLKRDANNGRLTGTTLGSVTDSYGYDANGLLASYTAQFSATTIYAETIVSRDGNGRITERTEALGGATHDWKYTYDVAGRLTDVTEDGSNATHYGYDADDNRTTFTSASGSVNPTYDAQDRLVSYGGATYAYTANGELTSKTASGLTTNYTYDAFGNLLHVGLPSGTNIDYVVDGENRRVGKKVGGTLTAGFLYQDELRTVAQLDGSGNVTARFVFGSKPNVPDYATTSAGTFRILSDHLGSPRLVVNSSSGSVVEQIDYDEFGNVTNDTSPAFVPFGFAGGMYDKDTGLVRFGARDFDASVGRWTSKDPIRFRGRQFNLYVYVGNDPVNRRDPRGRAEQANPGCALCIAAVTALAAACQWGEEKIGYGLSAICQNYAYPDDACKGVCAPLPPFPDCGPGYVGPDYDSFGNPCPGPGPGPDPGPTNVCGGPSDTSSSM